jgi:hypothetical protein
MAQQAMAGARDHSPHLRRDDDVEVELRVARHDAERTQHAEVDPHHVARLGWGEQPLAARIVPLGVEQTGQRLACVARREADDPAGP